MRERAENKEMGSEGRVRRWVSNQGKSEEERGGKLGKERRGDGRRIRERAKRRREAN